MTAVLVLEFDEAIRGSLHDLLSTEEHYDVVEVQSEADALAYLTAHAEGMIVVCGNPYPDHHLFAAFFARMVADANLATRHQYILLSTNPKAIPQELLAQLAQLGAPILLKPFDLDALLPRVREAAERLAASQAQAHAPKRKRFQTMQIRRGPGLAHGLAGKAAANSHQSE